MANSTIFGIVSPSAGAIFWRISRTTRWEFGWSASRKRPVYLSHQQVTALATASNEYEGLLLLLAYTGLRWGEAIGLRVRDLDMLRRRATISENAVQSGSRYS